MLVSRQPDASPEIFASVQGEGITAGTPSVFVRLAQCNLQCSWCFAEDTPILMADWSWKALGKVRVGDDVIAIDRPRRRGARVRLTRSTVTRVGVREAPTVTVNGGPRCTADHEYWLTGRGSSGASTVHSGWREVIRTRGARVLFTAPPIDTDEASWQRGWLAGMADGDGCFWTLAFRRGYRRFRLALRDERLLDRAESFARAAGFDLRRGRHNHNGFKGRSEMSCLWLTSDERARRFEMWLSETLGDRSWLGGYLGGILDAEGSLSHGVLRIAQSTDSRRRPRIESVLERLDLRFTKEDQGYYVHRARGQLWRLLAHARPAKQSVLDGAMGHHPRVSKMVDDVRSTGEVEPVVTLTTSAGSFVAGGYVVRNCDTRYTWDWEHHDPENETVVLEPEQAADRAVELAGDHIRNVVITGGEPLLQQSALADLAQRVKAAGMRIEVETNGTICPESRLASFVDQWNVSPKTSGSGNALDRREVRHALEWFASAPNAYWKIVMRSPDEEPEVVELLGRYRVPADRVVLMPEGTSAEGISRRGQWLAELCRRRGFRFSTRLHVLLWGNQRGR